MKNVLRPFRTIGSIAIAVIATCIATSSCVKDDETPRPTQTSYYGSFHDYKGFPVPGVKVMVYGELYYNPSGTLFGGRHKSVLLDSTVSDAAGQFSRTFTDQEDVDRYTFGTTNLEENLSGPLTRGQPNSIVLNTWRFFTVRLNLHVVNNAHPPLWLRCSLYDFKVHTPSFDTTVQTRIKWSTMYGNYAIYQLDSVQHVSGFPNLGYNITGNEKSDTVVVECNLDCSTF